MRYTISVRAFWIAVLLVFSSHALAQEGFVQLRFFYPYATDFSSSFALDAALKYKFESSTLTFAIKNSTLARQTVGIELAGDWGLASADFTGEAGAELDSRRIGITALGVWILPRSEGVTPLETVTLVLVHDTDDSLGASFYVVDVATLMLNGQIAQDWRWIAGYSLASTVTATTAIRHNLNAGVRGKLGDFTLGLGATLAQDKNIWIYGGNLDVAWQLSATENISARATLTSRPLDTQSLTFTSTAFQPVTLALSVGRSSLGGLTAGASLDASLLGGWAINASYAGAFGETSSHEFGGSLGYANRETRVGTGVNWNTVRNAGVWTSRLALNANAAYKMDNLSFSLRGAYSFDTTPNNINPQPNSGNASATLNWRSAPLEVIFETSFQFRGTVSGTAQLQVLYDITPQLAVNGSVLFTRVLTLGGQNGFSFGAGLRYRF
jgi:hypothetical protein